MQYKFLLYMLAVWMLAGACTRRAQLSFCGSADNDLYAFLEKEGFRMARYGSPQEAIAQAAAGSGVFIVADGYPQKKNTISPAALETARKKQLRLYVEYPASLPGLQIADTVFKGSLERGVVTSPVFGEKLPAMSLLGIHDCHLLPAQVPDPLIVLAKVAGFDKASYGLGGTDTYPLLFRKDNMLVGMSKLSNFETGRYGPNASWRRVWEYIVSWTAGKAVHFNTWPADVAPMYGKDEALPADARRNAIARGIQWYYNGHFFIHSSWKDLWLKYQGDGTWPFGPPVSQSLPNGNGTNGILEGHASRIYYNGTQQYRYWLRADVQGEAAYALAAAGSFLGKKEYDTIAANLINLVFKNSNLRSGPRSDPQSPVYGLIGWSVTHPGVFYGDDNARAILGVIGASAAMRTGQWNKEVTEAIMANFRTTGKQGFRGERLEEKDILERGWQYYWNRDLVFRSAHFESWMWACYLWLYDKTRYAPLLDRTKQAIGTMMAAFPDKWSWGSSIQTEWARMILPLAWLVRVEDTPRHRQWLDQVVNRLLRNQVACGAIREELGAGRGRFDRPASNKAYGADEGPLIFDNGDPVAEMLYTCNFALFSLNEAAHATGNEKYRAATRQLADFLVRIQVKSNRHKDLDGAWFRAFDYERWDYWASNSDAGWGAWCTLTGWIQSWIVTTEIQVEQNSSYWDITRNADMGPHMKQALQLMFRGL